MQDWQFRAPIQLNHNFYDDWIRNPPAPMVCRAPGLFFIFLVSVGLAAFQ
jgi:hypothetical protein